MINIGMFLFVLVYIGIAFYVCKYHWVALCEYVLVPLFKVFLAIADFTDMILFFLINS